MDFGEKGVNTGTGCISNGELERRQKSRCVMCGRETFKLDDGSTIHVEDGSSICVFYPSKITFTPHMETLRDRFAMAAMASMTFPHDSGISSYGMQTQVSMFVDGAYAIADAMMVRREK